MTDLEALVDLPWQRHQLAPQEPGTTGGRAPLEERDERSEKTENPATEYTQKLFHFRFFTLLLQETNKTTISQRFNTGNFVNLTPYTQEIERG